MGSCRFRLQLVLCSVPFILLLVYFREHIIDAERVRGVLWPQINEYKWAFLRNAPVIVAFGDSYTSEGWDGSETISPMSNYTKLTCSNGPVWARYLSNSFEPHSTLVNFAVSGATIDNSIAVHYKQPPPLDLQGQVRRFLTQSKANDTDMPWKPYQTLFLIAIGTNDVGMTFEPKKDKALSRGAVQRQMLERYFAAMDALYAAGARAFAFNLVGPYDRAMRGVSYGPKLQTELKNAIIEYNEELARAIDKFCTRKHDSTAGDIVCVVHDTYSLTNRVMDSPQDYGFKEGVDFCPSYKTRWVAEVDTFVDPKCVGPVGDYVWRDALHPSWRFHELWARDFRKQLLSYLPPLDNVL